MHISTRAATFAFGLLVLAAAAAAFGVGHGQAVGASSASDSFQVTATPTATDIPCPRPPMCTEGPPPTECVGCTPTPTPRCPPCRTRGPSPTPTDSAAESATPSPQPTAEDVTVCGFIVNRVPPVAISWALANRDLVSGWDLLENPALPSSPYNPPRRSLSILNVGIPYHPIYNGLVYRAGCP